MNEWRVAVAGAVLALGLAGCASTPTAAPVTSTVTAVSTSVSTVVSTVVSTLDPAAAASSAAAAKASMAEEEAAVAASASAESAAAARSAASESAAAAAEAGPIYYSPYCQVGGDYKALPTYKAAWKAKASTCSGAVTAGAVEHGLQMTATLKKALTTAYGPKASEDELGTLFGICAGINDFYTTKIVNSDQADEAAGALIICPDHPNAKKIRANIDAIRALIEAAGDPAADVDNVVTYGVTGSASTALVTYSESGSNIAQENDVGLPWQKVLVITGQYSVRTISAQSGGDGDITCTIKVGFKVVATVTSKGAYAVADCTAP